jgi:hypothetical protein
MTTKLTDQIQDIQRNLTENALTERAFVNALGDALNQVDQHLLNEVRRVGEEHAQRRGLILHELQSLAQCLCQFPARPEPRAAIDHREETPEQIRTVAAKTHAPGDWRKATSAIEDDAESAWRSNGTNH